MREVGKALGLSEDTVAALATTIWGLSNSRLPEEYVRQAGLDPTDPRIAKCLELTAELIGFPRHLSKHVGGFVLTRGPLSEVVPIGNAAMEDRTFIEWDKDDIDALGLMKVDVLGLGMLGCMRRAFVLLEMHKGVSLDLATIPAEDPATYAMICKADTMGTFQIESRAQMSMLPRLKPKTFYDLVIEVAIVRPGPIQGDMVHPYIRRREGKEAVTFPTEALRKVLGKTLGVPLFQEQAMQVAMVAAGFSATEADQLRRSMATFKFTGGIHKFEDKLITGMLDNGYSRDFAERTFRQLEGFGSYGFPESHAASFALIAYASSWMKCHHPEVFLAAILNAQPMGFYASAQLVRDAREHGVEVRPVDVNASEWDCTLEMKRDCQHAVRLGFRVARGLSEKEALRIVEIRAVRPFVSVEDVWRRASVSVAALEQIARADGFKSLGLSRREATWAIKGLRDDALPLFAAADERSGELQPEILEPAVVLPPMTAGREVVEDYRSNGLSLRGHPLAFLRDSLQARGYLACEALRTAPNGSRISIAGLVLVRQMPGSAKGVMFITLEDESANANLIVWPSVFEENRRAILGASLLGCRGKVQRANGVIHLIVESTMDLTSDLRTVSGLEEPFLIVAGRGDEARHSGGGDSREAKPISKPRDMYDPHPHIDDLKVKARNFR